MFMRGEEGMAELTSGEIAKVLNLDSIEVLERELILDASKRIERIKWRESEKAHPEQILIKYGRDPALLSEIFYYKELSKSVKDHLPQIIAHDTQNKIGVLVLEWIDGVNPDLSDQAIVKRVYKDYGKFAAKWGNQINEFDNEKITQLINNTPDYKGRLDHLIDKLSIRNHIDEIYEGISFCEGREDLLREVGGPEFLDLIKRMDKKWITGLINMLYKVPCTLHPGDVSKFNTLIRHSNNQVLIIDFENMKIGPMSLLMEYIGEEDIHVPPSQLNETALRSYVEGWNKHSMQSVKWEQFYKSYLAARIFYKIYLIQWYLNKFENKSRRTPEPTWVKRHVQDLLIYCKLIEK